MGQIAGLERVPRPLLLRQLHPLERHVLHCEQAAVRTAEVQVPDTHLAQERSNQIKRKHLFDTHSAKESPLASRPAIGKP